MTLFRYRLALALEAIVWIAAMGWLFFLISDAAGAWRDGGMPLWRDVFEILLLGLLVWWPILRTRIMHGYWMKDWSDAPARRNAAPIIDHPAIAASDPRHRRQ